MDFKVGQTVWILGAKADEFSANNSPWIYPKSFFLEEATILEEIDEDGFVLIGVENHPATYVQPNLLLHEKPDLSILRFSIEKSFTS